jgi:enoyl-CoA hydratase/carnithine racemase
MTNPSEPHGIVVRQVSAGVQRWELHNPKRRNAIAPEALRWIASASRDLSGEIVLLAGAGDEAFCAGFDLNALQATAAHELPDASPRDASPPDASLIDATRAMTRADATFVGVVNGYAIGAGVELACACDMLVVRHDAWFQVPAGRLGVVYHADGLARMRAVFGPVLTRRLVLLGERVAAHEASAVGAFARCVAADELETTTQEVTTALQATAPLALRGNRDLLRLLDRGPIDDAQRQTHEQARTQAYRSDDHHEARRAVTERRPPRFRGR